MPVEGNKISLNRIILINSRNISPVLPSFQEEVIGILKPRNISPLTSSDKNRTHTHARMDAQRLAFNGALG